MRLRIRAGHQRAVAVVDVDLDTQRARDGIDRARAARDLRGKAPARILRRRQIDGRAGRHAGRAVLWHIDEHAQRVRLFEMEQFAGQARAARRAARGDERADVDVACGDHAVERRGDRLVRHEFGKMRDVRLRGREHRALRVHVRDLRVGVLLRDRLRFQHVLPALCGRFRIVVVRLRARFVRTRLAQLRVEIGRRDLRERLPSLHVRAEIGAPVRDIAARARIDRRVRIRHHRAGQRQRLVGRRRAGHDDRHRQRLLRGDLRALRGACIDPRHDAEREQRGGERDGRERHGQLAAAAGRRRIGGGAARGGRHGCGHGGRFGGGRRGDGFDRVVHDGSGGGRIEG